MVHKRRRNKNIVIKFFSHLFKHFGYLLKWFVFGFVIIAGGFALTILGVVLYYNSTLPNASFLNQRNTPQSTKIYDRNGSLLYEVHGEIKRTSVDLAHISGFLKEATIAVEDKDFYKHGALSWSGIARSLKVNSVTSQTSQGGSTITQQFVKNALLSGDKTWERKLKEVLLSLKIESQFSKDQILNLYLNEIPYGRNSYGVEAASQSYFGKSAQDLNLAESAYLAALPQAPSHLNPSGPNFSELEARKNIILDLMLEQGYISTEQHDLAKTTEVNFVAVKSGIIAPQFVFWVESVLEEKYGKDFLEEGGLKVYTTLDPDLQALAEKVVKEGVEVNAKKYNAHNAALVAVDPATGQVLAMVGSKDYYAKPDPPGCVPGRNCLFEPQTNVAIAQRQPGSSFKPYTYLTAFGPDFSLTPQSKVADVAANFGGPGNSYVPINYNGHAYGIVTIRKALAGSLNISAVRTLARVGVQNVVNTAHSLGITSPLQGCGLTLTLGGCEVRLVDHVQAFSVIANEGLKQDQTPILLVQDKNGKIVEEYKKQFEQVANPQAAYELLSILTDNDARTFIFGAKSPLTLPDRPVAAKTGTTDNWHDGWTVGSTPQLTAGVWAGNNDGTLLRSGADGVFVAAPIWQRFMIEAMKNKPVLQFPIPPGIVLQNVSKGSGKIVTKATPGTRVEPVADYALAAQQKKVASKPTVQPSTAPANTPAPVATKPKPIPKPSNNLPANIYLGEDQGVIWDEILYFNDKQTETPP